MDASLIIISLSVLLVLAIVVILIQYDVYTRNKGKQNSGASNSVPRRKYDEVKDKRDMYLSQLNTLKAEKKILDKNREQEHREYLQCKDDLGKAALDINELKEKINKLKQKNSELTRDNDELKKLVGSEPTPIDEINTSLNNSSADSKVENSEDTSSLSETQQVEDTTKEEKLVENAPQEPVTPPNNTKTLDVKEVTMYASFPRSAGNDVYFSDLTDTQEEDSYFELNISFASGKATFKPLDFMKIRNYDTAMYAISTEGAKPAVALQVQGIELGKAHMDGKDWIVDDPAKIKLT